MIVVKAMRTKTKKAPDEELLISPKILKSQNKYPHIKRPKTLETVIPLSFRFLSKKYVFGYVTQPNKSIIMNHLINSHIES